MPSNQHNIHLLFWCLLVCELTTHLGYVSILHILVILKIFFWVGGHWPLEKHQLLAYTEKRKSVKKTSIFHKTKSFYHI